MDVSYVQALLLGLVQGLTEFLPVSSSAHLAWAQELFHLDAGSDAMLFFDLMVHIGTVVAITVVFYREFIRFFHRLLTEATGRATGPRIAWRIMLLGILASVPAAVIGLTFKDELEKSFGRPFHIGLELIVSGFFLWGITLIPRPRRGWKRFKAWQAFLVGCAQALAIVPGISRSGATISTAMYTGLRRRWAGEFSFFIGMPAICGAALLHTRDIMEHTGASLGTLLTGPIIAGTIVATISGIFALGAVMRSLRAAKFQYFSYYCWIAGAAALIVFRHSS